MIICLGTNRRGRCEYVELFSILVFKVNRQFQKTFTERAGRASVIFPSVPLPLLLFVLAVGWGAVLVASCHRESRSISRFEILLLVRYFLMFDVGMWHEK